MSGWNLPPGVTLADIDALFDALFEEQCLSTEIEERAALEPWTPEELAGMEELANWEPIF